MRTTDEVIVLNILKHITFFQQRLSLSLIIEVQQLIWQGILIITMCKVNGCLQKHAHHFCRVCSKSDSTHFSRHCPQGTTIYHGTKIQFAKSIQKNGFQISNKGRIGPGVYFTLDYKEAQQIAKYKFGNNGVVIECRAIVSYNKFSREDNEQELLKKLDEWYKFCKETAKQAFHPPWANNKEFKEVCVKDPKSISIVNIHHL